jgi:hypothetical protein
LLFSIFSAGLHQPYLTITLIPSPIGSFETNTSLRIALLCISKSLIRFQSRIQTGEEREEKGAIC